MSTLSTPREYLGLANTNQNDQRLAVSTRGTPREYPEYPL